MSYSHGELVQLAEEGRRKKMAQLILNLKKLAEEAVDAEVKRRDLVEVVRCKCCKWWNKKKRVCEHPEWTDMDGWHKATDADDYCFRGERKEKTDAEIH